MAFGKTGRKPKLDLSDRAVALLQTPPVRLQQFILGQRYNASNADTVGKELLSLAIHAAAYEAYLQATASNRNHANALKAFNTQRRKVANALGYKYRKGDDDIYFAADPGPPPCIKQIEKGNFPKRQGKK